MALGAYQAAVDPPDPYGARLADRNTRCPSSCLLRRCCRMRSGVQRTTASGRWRRRLRRCTSMKRYRWLTWLKRQWMACPATLGPAAAAAVITCLQTMPRQPRRRRRQMPRKQRQRGQQKCGQLNLLCPAVHARFTSACWRLLPECCLLASSALAGPLDMTLCMRLAAPQAPALPLEHAPMPTHTT